MKKRKTWMTCTLVVFALGGCTQAADQALPEITVHKSASCGCCKVWAQHLRNAGFAVAVQNTDSMSPVKERLGVPARLASCHTAEVNGYFVEGHVPAEDIRRLLRDRPDAKGLAVPGMPAGSPGMEVPSGHVDSFDVLLVGRDGDASVFSRHGQQEVKRQ